MYTETGNTLHLAGWDSVLEHAPAHKKKLYTQIIDEILGKVPGVPAGFQPQDKGGLAFSKTENYYAHSSLSKTAYSPAQAKEPGSKLPRPRCIVGRSLKHVLHMARILIPIEDFTYARLLGSDGLRAMAKGLNSADAANLLVQKWELYAHPFALCGDCSSFDGHVSVDQLKAVQQFYKRLFPQLRGHPWHSVFSAQLKNKISSRLGVDFVSTGRRMSGDRDTAFGNTLLTYMMVHIALKGRRFSLICDGDDFVVVCERSEASGFAETLVESYARWGHELEFDVKTDVLEHVDFCQKKMVKLHGGWRLVRNPLKVLSGSAHSTRNFDSPRSARVLFASVGLGDSYANAGVPVLQSFSRMIWRLATGTEISDVALEDANQLLKTLHPSDPLFQRLVNERNLPIDTIIDFEARLSFERAYGITPAEQIRLENWFQKQTQFDFSIPEPEPHPCEGLYA